jgi:hypothetical protein
MSSWAPLLAATGFKPDVPNKSLGLAPTVPGDFHAPWVTASGYGSIRRAGRTLAITCTSGALELKRLKTEPQIQSIELNGRRLDARIGTDHDAGTIEFTAPILLREGDELSLA